MFFESHAHYDDEAFDEDRSDLLPDLKEKGIHYVVNVGANIPSSKKSIELAQQHTFVYAAVGVHPHDVENLSEKDMEIVRNLTKEEKVVSIGEIGLDYYYDHSPRDIQRKWFERQMQIAQEVNLPIIVHSREAAEDTFNCIEGYAASGLNGVIHCYSGSVEMAKKYMDMGFYIGVGGVVTFKNAKRLVQVVKEIPLSHILLETDCPYLAPVPNRGKRNDSRNLIYIAEVIANIKGVSVEEIAAYTMENAKNLFFANNKILS